MTIARRLPAEDDGGQVTAFVVVFTAALLLMVGLVIDGGLTLAAKVRAIDEAQSAARAGAQEIQLAIYRQSGQVTLDANRAVDAARSYLAGTGDPGQVSVTGDQVTVTVRVTQPMQVLGLVGIGSLRVSGTGSATAVRGITEAGQ